MNDNQPRRRSAYSQSAQGQPEQPVYHAEQANMNQRSRVARAQQMNQPVQQPQGRVERPRYSGEAQSSYPVQQPGISSSAYTHQQSETFHADASYCPASGHYVPQGSRSNAAKQPKQRAAQKQRPASRAAQLNLSRLLLLVCAVVFVVSAFLLVRYFVNILITRRASAQLEAVYSAAVETTEAPTNTPVPTATPAPTATPEAKAAAVLPMATEAPQELWPSVYPQNPTLRVSSVFYELQRQNPDIIGWLKIDGVLEEAVVQRDNEYYLTHNALKQKSVTGALFLDELCDLKTVPSQMLIHGHNMKEGAMFGSLKKYKVKDASFYREHPYIEFNTIYENSRFVIFAVAEVDLRMGKSDYLPFWQDVRFSSAASFTSYVKKARDLSHYRCNVDVQPGDRLLTLSTCTGTDDNKRLIVMARRIRDDEDLTQLNMSILTTGNR